LNVFLYIWLLYSSKYLHRDKRSRFLWITSDWFTQEANRVERLFSIIKLTSNFTNSIWRVGSKDTSSSFILVLSMAWVQSPARSRTCFQVLFVLHIYTLRTKMFQNRNKTFTKTSRTHPYIPQAERKTSLQYQNISV